MEQKTIIIGSRGSDLALWQAHYLQDQLKANGHASEIKIIKTKGDKIQHLSFDKIEGKGFFTKEIEDQLLDGSIDVAVHSMKDLPTSSPEGLRIAATSYREDPSDTLLIRSGFYDPTQNLRLKEGTIVGTSSARRKAQLMDLNSTIQTEDIRGNVPTRIEKLREGQFGAIVLATAGLNRLQLDVSDLEVVRLHPREFVPAPAQGVLAYQTRNEDMEMRKVINKIGNRDVAFCTNVERRVLQMMDGGCHLPLGVYCEQDQMGNYHTWSAMSAGLDQPMKRCKISQSTYAGLAEEIYNNLQEQFKQK
ncbi:MAG: hydroxymethylbilane synthase [Saprospiraceae bacterium]|nr:hydroxymethylbilane synthase [Saprospiraceae bacterium]